MKLNWAKWGLEFWKSVSRHSATAGSAYLAVLEVQKIPFSWEGLGAAVIVGGVLRSVFTFLETTPTPDDDDEKTS